MTQMFGMKLVYENRPYMHIDMENTIVMKIEGKQVAAPPEDVPAAAPVAETKLVVEQQRTVHTEEKALPAARRVAAPTTARAAAPAPVPTPVVAAATPVVSSPSKKPVSAEDTGSSAHNYLIAGVIVAGIASVIAMVVMRKK
jgi:hypothetical protein